MFCADPIVLQLAKWKKIQLRYERNGGSDALPFSSSDALADLNNTKQQEIIPSNPSRGENRKVATIQREK